MSKPSQTPAQHSPLPLDHNLKFYAEREHIREEQSAWQAEALEVDLLRAKLQDMKAHAQRLADALRNLSSFSFTEKEYQESLQTFVKLKREARQALAQWEAAQ